MAYTFRQIFGLVLALASVQAAAGAFTDADPWDYWRPAAESREEAEPDLATALRSWGGKVRYDYDWALNAPD